MSDAEKLDLQKLVESIKPIPEDVEKAKLLKLQQRRYEFSEAIKDVLPSRMLEYRKYYPKMITAIEDKKAEFIKSKFGLWLICGISGSGKTCFVSDIIHKTLWNNPKTTCSYKLTSGFFIDLREAIQGKYESEYLRNMTKADLLVLDDFGANGYSEYEKTTFQHIVTSKEANNTKLIVVTNMSIKQSKALITKPSVRRFDESFGILEI